MTKLKPWRNSEFPVRRTEAELRALLLEAHADGVADGRLDRLAGDPVMDADAAEFWARLRTGGSTRFDQSDVAAISAAYLAGYREQVQRVIGGDRPSSGD
jgi:hypothetical protein